MSVKKCSDIPTLPILRFLASLGKHWGNWFEVNPRCEFGKRSVRNAMPAGINDKLIHAKMRKLIAKGLVGGCDCGCRGDFVLSDEGRALLDREDR